MSPISPVFHTVVTVNLSLMSISSYVVHCTKETGNMYTTYHLHYMVPAAAEHGEMERKN